ncbi:MAG: hypothetical protein ABI889_14230 [Gemmatimonadota bacterium]
MGAQLGTIFARAGHDVVFSYSHNAKKLEQLANSRYDLPSSMMRSTRASAGNS